MKLQLNLKEEEKNLLNVQIAKLTQSLEEERKQNAFLTSEINEIKTFYKQLNEKNTVLINQLEMDNNEIKKRLVKLIKYVERDFTVDLKKIIFIFILN